MVANSFSDDSERIINNLRRKLAEIRSHDGDAEWFGRHESSTRDTIRRAIEKAPVYHEAIDTLLICLKNLRSHKAFQWWDQIVADALLVASNLKDEKRQARLWLAYGDFMLQENQPGMAARSAEIGTACLPDTSSAEDNMQRVQAILIMICAFQPANSEAKVMGLIGKVLRFVRQSEDLEFKARTYQMLAHIYTHQGNYKPAVRFTELALDLWETVGDPYGKADSLINLSRIARKQNQLDKVEDLMSQIKLDPNSANGHRQFMHRMYEEAAFMLESGNFEKAQELLELTIEHLQTMKLSRDLATVKHTLALAQIARHNFEQAEETLATVDASWNKLQYHYGRAEVCAARSYLERERGRKVEAKEWLERARAICPKIENEPMRQQMIAMIDGESGKIDV